MSDRGPKLTLQGLAKRLGGCVTADKLHHWCKTAGLPHVQTRPRAGIYVFWRDYVDWVSARRRVCVDGVCQVA